MRRKVIMFLLRWLCSFAFLIDGAIGVITLGKVYPRLHTSMIKIYFRYSVNSK